MHGALVSVEAYLLASVQLQSLIRKLLCSGMISCLESLAGHVQAPHALILIGYAFCHFSDLKAAQETPSKQHSRRCMALCSLAHGQHMLNLALEPCDFNSSVCAGTTVLFVFLCLRTLTAANNGVNGR